MHIWCLCISVAAVLSVSSVHGSTQRSDRTVLGPFTRLRMGRFGMSEHQQTRGGFVGFMTTIPGVLTAIAAVITATGGIYLGAHKEEASAVKSLPVSSTASTSGNETPPPTGTPVSIPPSVTSASVDPASLRLGNVPGGVASNDPVQQLIDECGQGDESACIAILEELVQECSEGALLSCDVLYYVSPTGSEYEQYGATCGGLLTADYAGSCRFQ